LLVASSAYKNNSGAVAITRKTPQRPRPPDKNPLLPVIGSGLSLSSYLAFLGVEFTIVTFSIALMTTSCKSVKEMLPWKLLHETTIDIFSVRARERLCGSAYKVDRTK